MDHGRASRSNRFPVGFLLEVLESRLVPATFVTDLFDPSSLLIKLAPAYAAKAEQLQLLDGVKLERPVGAISGLWQAKITDSNLSVDQVIEALELDPRVSYVSVNGFREAQTTPNDPQFSAQWDLNPIPVSIHATVAWDAFTGNGSTLVAVFDSGVDINHPDLKSRIWTNTAEIPGDGLDNDRNGVVDDLHGASFAASTTSNDVSDSQGHGTAVAGIIGATGNNGVGIAGVNWATRILPLKVIQNGAALDSDILQAMDYATRAGAKIWNLSLGGGAYSRAMSDALDAASARGVIIVTAAGNAGTDIDLTPSFPASYSAENLVVVAGTDDADKLAGFSNFGVATVDLAAPSTNLLTTVPGGGYGFKSGTSMAAARVSGALSLLWDAAPSSSSGLILDQLFQFITQLDSLKGKMVTGGRLDLGLLPGQRIVAPVAPEESSGRGGANPSLPLAPPAITPPSTPMPFIVFPKPYFPPTLPSTPMPGPGFLPGIIPGQDNRLPLVPVVPRVPAPMFGNNPGGFAPGNPGWVLPPVGGFEDVFGGGRGIAPGRPGMAPPPVVIPVPAPQPVAAEDGPGQVVRGTLPPGVILLPLPQLPLPQLPSDGPEVIELPIEIPDWADDELWEDSADNEGFFM